MTKEERELRREQREHMKRMEAAAKEAGRGPIDVPFLLLVLLLTRRGAHHAPLGELSICLL